MQVLHLLFPELVFALLLQFEVQILIDQQQHLLDLFIE
jgi:hypothetical protein